MTHEKVMHTEKMEENKSATIVNEEIVDPLPDHMMITPVTAPIVSPKV
jgi:hypothetical protein